MRILLRRHRRGVVDREQEVDLRRRHERLVGLGGCSVTVRGRAAVASEAAWSFVLLLAKQSQNSDREEGGEQRQREDERTFFS